MSLITESVWAATITQALPESVTAEPVRVQALIDRAWTRLGALVTLPVDDTSPRWELARLMVVEAVQRVLLDRAPGLQSESEAGYSYTKTSALDTSANIWFPKTDLDLLGGPTASRVGTIHYRRTPRRLP